MIIFRLYEEIFIKSSNWNIAVFQFCSPIQQRQLFIHIGPFSSVAPANLSLRSMVCSRPGFPVFHHLPEFAQTPVHWVGDAIQPSHPLSPTSPPALNLSQQDLGIMLSEDTWTTSVHFLISQSVHRMHMSQQSNPCWTIAIICPISSCSKASFDIWSRQ